VASRISRMRDRPVAAVGRVIDAGRIRPQEATPAATQILSATHGFVLLAMSGFIDSQGVQDVVAPMAVNLMVGLGDTRRRAERSLAAVVKARTSQQQTVRGGDIATAHATPRQSPSGGEALRRKPPSGALPTTAPLPAVVDSSDESSCVTAALDVSPKCGRENA
jgi:hypothetical protein